MNGRPAVEFARVSKSFDGGRSFVLREFDLTVRTGELLALVGPSGCGKTTALRLINRLIEPDSGRVCVAEREVREVEPHALRRSIGYVIQDCGLMPHMTVEANAALVPRLLGWDETRRVERAREALRLVGLEPETFAQRAPDELSGGQRQRVGIARAIAAEPEIVLMDEPFAALDPPTREALRNDVRTWQRQRGWTIVLVTHDIATALLIADRIAVFGPQRLIALGAPVELLASADEGVRALLETPTRHAETIAGLVERSRHSPRAS